MLLLSDFHPREPIRLLLRTNAIRHAVSIDMFGRSSACLDGKPVLGAWPLRHSGQPFF